MIVTWDEALAESYEKGFSEGSMTSIVEVARLLFPPLPQEFEDRVCGIRDPERLKALLQQVVTADAITEIDWDSVEPGLGNPVVPELSELRAGPFLDSSRFSTS